MNTHPIRLVGIDSLISLQNKDYRRKKTRLHKKVNKNSRLKLRGVRCKKAGKEFRKIIQASILYVNYALFISLQRFHQIWLLWVASPGSPPAIPSFERYLNALTYLHSLLAQSPPKLLFISSYLTLSTRSGLGSETTDVDSVDSWKQPRIAATTNTENRISKDRRTVYVLLRWNFAIGCHRM